jgi:hypothetical protein
MNRTVLGLVVGMLFVLPEIRVCEAEQPAEKIKKPCVVISGADSLVAKPRYQRITSLDEWARVWQEHKGAKITTPYDFFYDPLTIPQIDFENYMVVAVFGGENWNSAGYRGDSISEDNNRLILKFKEKGYQTAGPGGGGKKAAPYGFFVVPRSDKPLALFEDVRSMRDNDPVWKEQITFPALER